MALSAASGQEAVVEEVRVEGSFSSGLQIRPDPAVRELRDRLTLRGTEQRALELEKANENVVTKLLNLTRYIPIPLGGSEDPVDTFFLQNQMRPDLNPPTTDPLGLNAAARRKRD